MEFAITYPSRPDAWKDVVIAEDSGFANCWFYDSQMIYSDIYACMALAAEHTRRSGWRPVLRFHQIELNL